MIIETYLRKQNLANKIMRIFFISALIALGGFGVGVEMARAAEYHIGPDQTYTTIGSFLWTSLVAGDTVYIHAKDNQEPYYEHLYISAALQGTQQNPIRIIGVSDGLGNQPILDGTNCTTGSNFDDYGAAMYHSDLGLVVFGPSTAGGSASAPQWVEMSSLKLQNYRNISTTDKFGATRNNVSGGGVYLQGGQHITLDNMEITGTADGIFGKDYSSPVKWITLKQSYIHDNGVVGNYLYHNVYTEVKYLTLEYNHFGPPISGSPGNNIKDRGVGTVIRYNWVQDGGHILDLVECQDNCADHTSDPAWDQTFVYGNVFYASPTGPTYLIHFGTGDTQTYARKNLYFYNNTVITSRNQSASWYVTLFQLSGSQQTVYLDNNIWHTTAATQGQSAPEICLQYDGSGSTYAAGNMIMGNNWISPGWTLARQGYTLTGTVTGASNIISPLGNNPYFTDIAAQDYHLSSASGAIGAANSLPSLLGTGGALGQDLTPVNQYVKHQTYETRSNVNDLGAYDYSSSDTAAPASPNGLSVM